MTDKEKKAIEYLKRHIIPCYGRKGTIEFMLNDIVLNLIEKQSKEIEYQIEKRENQKKELAILNAKQVEFNKLINTVNSYKGQFKKQQKEIEELIEQGREEVREEIKAKIEEYENKIKKIRSKKSINEPEDTINITRYTHYISVLQSLLEKE